MKVLICVEAGTVAQVVVDDPNADVILVDRDLAGEEDDCVIDLTPDDPAHDDWAFVCHETAIVDPAYINRIEHLMQRNNCT